MFGKNRNQQPDGFDMSSRLRHASERAMGSGSYEDPFAAYNAQRNLEPDLEDEYEEDDEGGEAAEPAVMQVDSATGLPADGSGRFIEPGIQTPRTPVLYDFSKGAGEFPSERMGGAAPDDFEAVKAAMKEGYDGPVVYKEPAEGEKPKKKKKKKKGEDESVNMADLFDALAEHEDPVRIEVENGIVSRIRDRAKGKFGTRILTERDSEEFKNELSAAIEDMLKDEPQLAMTDRPAMTKRIMALIVGYGPLDELFEKKYNEIMVSRYDRIFVEENGDMVLAGVRFGSEDELQQLIQQIVGGIGRVINQTNPICDGFLPDGSRFNAVLPPIAADGATLTIRRFPEKKLTGEEYLKFGSLDERILKFLKLTVEAKFNLICSGGTGSGKTSLLNLMSNFLSYNPGLSVVSIEDSLELRIAHPNVRREQTRKSTAKDNGGEVTARDLVKNALRQRPDVIVIGEIRDGTMADFLRAAGSGHDGCMTTIHANNPRELEQQVIVLFMMAKDYNLDPDTIRMMYSSSVDIVIQIKRYPDHARRISQIAHVVGYGDYAAEQLGIRPGDPEYDPHKVYVRDIFRWRKTGEDPVTGKFTGVFEPTGYIPKALTEKAANNGVKFDMSMFTPDEEAV